MSVRPRFNCYGNDVCFTKLAHVLSVLNVFVIFPSVHALTVLLARTVKLTLMTVHHRHFVTMEFVKMALTTLVASVIEDSREGFVIQTLMIAKVITSLLEYHSACNESSVR